ncbi:dihydrolipoamide succinyltransferase [Solemya pervernicosa gill symbiont]|uniref:Dihydrolipoyllysine-residue succinyltransferase component of 2-oxoglutarate dehydrogenase complex n=2 Tax=Gammaproteobacteria incertae sedis TaxID=118884 RepID=A0A1T2L7T1_9GAMM|nr:2-oxoglutarate dehydrogenase complex dihydrolipoyllysine-residue succinyltransferase [Candidatus Reidiella endopervernicosa]OOZ41094.1 dihydrolipoamide succinyltransferase [Solemya pervernicosa gill symbiont]QKQ26255.1 2-oxoglutarate dehydrogenase complex dihydrolipoyllysine-residue succinyltransferase [Candidatus Reidiella endopervernicosa]
MSIEIKAPDFPESVTDGTLVTWHKQVGDSVRRDEVLADIETDKVVFEVASLEAGVVESLLVEQGAVVLSGQLIARLGAAQADAAKAPVAAAASATVETVEDESAEEPLLTPSAKKMIAEQGLDVAQISGSGKDGRVLKEDVLAYLESRDAQPVTKPPSQQAVTAEPLVGDRSEKRVPMTRLRARIAERLLEAQSSAAILTTFNEIDMSQVMALRSRYRDQFEKRHGVRLGFMSFFVKAAVEALRRFPEVNASIDGNDMVYHGFVDIGIAVGSPRGLVVPILRDADTLNMAQIEQNITDFGQRAQAGSLSIDEITGGTFSITNGGVFGSLLSTPILNPPQSAILGMHKIEKRAVVVNDEIVIRPMMYLALSYDHRIVDGREAVQFLVTIKEMLEDPTRLLLEV